MTPRVIFADDDRDVRDAVGQSLELADFQVTLCKSFIEAIDHITPALAGVVVTDIRMPGKDGFDLLARCLKIDADLPIIVLTGEGDIPMAVKAMTQGAYDFLEKPCPPKRLIDAINRAWDKRKLVLENRALMAERGAITKTRYERAQEGLTVQMEMVEKLLIEAALTDNFGRVAAVAETLKIPRKTLYDKLKRHNIDPSDFRAGPEDY